MRLFHWSLVAALGGAWWTAGEERSETHALFGYAVLALLTFRILWGFTGSQTARFRLFLAPPSAALEHARALLRRGPMARPLGHNPLGGYAAMLLLGAVAVQGATGLFLYDDELFWAPLNAWVSAESAEFLKLVHHLNFKLLQVLAAVHVAAILFYLAAKGLDLIRPMITGRARLERGLAAPKIASNLLAAGLAALSALLVWGLISFA